jgi:hypothetical protein
LKVTGSTLPVFAETNLGNKGMLLLDSFNPIEGVAKYFQSKSLVTVVVDFN